MILCVTLCVVHGLLLIPCLLSLTDPLLARIQCSKKQ
ncbi:unnamed protein product [Nippostrongylus brasiliensis]|uniref:Uncharacterized protein n=1 Tax=Nippostrongylus brasiliensis TaxID=27835 RepID=A0A0N4YXD3_NIPBR|nr:unnamed protein product [Nippostrongylus brasiliensis]